jgi:hypothetical protein
MIWFACKQCGKRHSRPESSIGTLIFCDCGQSNTVPWESTVEPPPVAEAPEPARPAIPLPTAPRLDPIPVGEERVPPRRREPELERPRPGRRPGPRRRDPRFCLNHEDAAMAKTCADCGDAFCAECLVDMRGVALCGPCKNFRARLLQRPPQMSGKALSSVLVAILCLPLPLCLGIGFGWEPLLPLLALLPNLTALALGVWALHDTQVNPRISGQAMAVTGMLTGALACVLSVLLTIYPAFALG